MQITRREFLRASSAIAAAVGLGSTGLFRVRPALAAEGAAPVIWLDGQSCSGCSVSLLNTIYYSTIDDLLTKTIDLEFHPTVMAAAGQSAVQAALDAKARGGYVLVVEGAIPAALRGRYCYLWPGMTAVQGIREFAASAAYVLAVGACAAYGGIPGARGASTKALSVQELLGKVKGKQVINIPGCPANPDWIVGTVAYILANNRAPALDAQNRPTAYFGGLVHDNCPLRDFYDSGQYAAALGGTGCLRRLGCGGPTTHADCPSRKWNGSAANTPGVNWCVAAGAPCQGCTEPTFPDGFSPFYAARQTPFGIAPTPDHGGGQPCSTCHIGDGKPNKPPTIKAGTPVPTPGHGGGAVCTSCHRVTGAPVIPQGSTPPSGHYSGDCANCHTYGSGGGGGHGGGKPCSTCHG